VSDAALLERLGQALAPAYEMEGELGRGGMAIVYRARDVRLKRGVAVKLLPPELAFRADIRSRFLREAETAARLSHPNIVPIYTVDERDGLVFFVMALVRGGSVGDRLNRGEKFSVADTRRIVREVADALDYAHRAGVVHRDIKPDNILLDADSGRAMVTDFGIARAASEDAEGASRLTATGAVVGTPAYMSPEQCAGDREIDGRSDLYSLGTVAYQMLTGQPPFAGGNTPAIMMKQVTEKPVPVSDRAANIPKDLAAIVMRLLEKSPEHRFATGQEVVAALDGASVAPAPRPSRHDDLPKYVMDVHGIGGHAVPPIATDGLSKKELRGLRKAEKRARTLPDRVRKFRGNLFSFGGTSLMLFGINAATSGLHGHLWFIYPTLGMMLASMIEMGTLVGEDGVPIKHLFFGPLPQHGALPASLAAAADDDVLAGPHGAVLRQAKSDHKRVRELVAKLSDAERTMLPDVQGTADSLYERVDSLGHALHQLDFKTNPAANRLADIDARIADAQRAASDERKLSLLRRQREMIVDLEQSRARLVDQYESAGLLLQNLALDLLKVRSSGLDSALGGITSATQEARALSREIGYVLNAAEELRGLEGKSK
jgi:serine/threonine protein kinase